MQSSADAGQQRIFALGTWPLSAAIAILVSIAASLSMHWRIGSPQLLVITIASLLLAALFIGVYRSRGRFRLHALLVLMTLVGVGAATIGRQIIFVEKHRALARLIVERNGQVIVWGASSQEFEGWRMIEGGYAIPSWLHPLYDYFANTRVGQITIPADLLTMANLELLPLDDDLWHSEITLDGIVRDHNALQKFNSYQNPASAITVRAKHITDDDLKYLSVLRGKPHELILESPSLEDIRRLQQFKIENPWMNDWEVDASDPPGFSTVVEVDEIHSGLMINHSVLSRETIASIDVFSEVQVLEIQNSTLEQGAFDELANLTRIPCVRFEGCIVTDADLLALSRSKKIAHLSFVGTQITDKGLESLGMMKQLVHIELTNSKCTWKGIQELCRNLQLKSFCTDIAKQPPDPTGRPIQPSRYERDMIREQILGVAPETPANPTGE